MKLSNGKLTIGQKILLGYVLAMTLMAITGFAGPAGGCGENPVGTIYLGMHAPGGDWSRKLTYPGPRGAVKQRSVTAAIDWLRREILREARKVTVPLVN